MRQKQMLKDMDMDTSFSYCPLGANRRGHKRLCLAHNTSPYRENSRFILKMGCVFSTDTGILLHHEIVECFKRQSLQNVPHYCLDDGHQ